MRYTCEQHEGMHGYGWDEFDTRRGGVQTIHDAENHIDLTISFVKIPGGSHGGSWAARIKGTPRDDAPPDLKTAMILYAAQDGWGSSIVPDEENEMTQYGFPGDFTLKGNSEALGEYKLTVSEGKGDRPTSDHELNAYRDLSVTTVQSMVIPEEYLWQAKLIVFRQLKAGVDVVVEKYDQEHLPPAAQVYQLSNSPGEGNAHTVEKIFEGPFEFDVYFSSGSAGKDVTAEDLTREIKQTSERFNERFSSVFALKAPFTAEKYKKFAKSMFSNLIGGIGYFYGDAVVDRSYAPEYDEENEGFWEETAQARARKAEENEGPFELFSSIPSRPFFPRGFLWDEGFHLMPIADWDIGLTLEIVKSWFNLIDDDGWIAREQILGAEARSKVPAEFQVQYPHYANPPTLYMIIDTILDKIARKTNGTGSSAKEQLSQPDDLSDAYIDNPDLSIDYLRQLYPLLRRQYNWFKKTQSGDIKSYDRQAFSTREAYRWRGRTQQHCLPSGLDDYPRPQPPHPGELHVDLMSWMGLLTKSLIRVAETAGFPEEVNELQTNLAALERNLVDLHWSDKEEVFCDATIDDYEEHKLVCHKGYISIFPFLTGLLKPDDPKLGKILKLIGDEGELFSPHGLRSLSKKDPLYGQDENYWRSPIWVNINYMAIVQLHVRPLCSRHHIHWQ
jgi:mannosyl-oligosaccharide glucosidase